MDSGNSGSLQSSSGGDEEYDSRAADSFSAFMAKTTASGHISPHILQPPQTSAMFSPSLLSNYFDPTLPPNFTDQNSLPLLNLDVAWPKTLRSDPCSPQINPVFPPPGSSAQKPGGFNAQSSFPSTAEAHASGSGTAADAAGAAGKEHSPRVMRNPKKRSRASRRAPTTVLTTDTTNFRAMVQEFTGIPAPPFTASTFPRTRLDIFGAPSAFRSAGSYANSSQPPYLRRPFPQKIQPSPQPSPFLPPPLVDTLASSSTNNLFNIQQNSLLSSLLQSSPKYPRDSLEIPKMGTMDEFGSVNNALTGLPSLISPDQAGPRRTQTGPACWGGGLRQSANDNDQLQGISTDNHLISNNGEINGNHNIPSASSNFLGDKAPENVSGRGEGMTESWICSSDLK